MTRIKVLLGHFAEQTQTDGSQSLNDAILDGLKEYVDICVIVTPYWKRDADLPLIEEQDYCGFPALCVRPKTELSFDLTPQVVKSENVLESQKIAKAITHFAMRQNVDVVHILQWGHLKGAIFEGAIRSLRPFLHTPYDYWSVCPQYYLRYKGSEPTCSGPDPYGRKCLKCLEAQFGNSTFSDRIAKQRGVKALITSMQTSNIAMDLLGSRFGAALGYNFGRIWNLANHIRSLKGYLQRAALILPMSTPWGQELQKHLELAPQQLRTCSPSLFEATSKLPKGDRFQSPLQFGHPHRVSAEGGTFFTLDAWRKSGIRADEGILNIYAQAGGGKTLREKGYGDLIEGGSVAVHEGRIAGKLDEVFAPLAAVISGYQWNIGGCGNIHAIARGVPCLASRWDFPGSESESVVREGKNCLLYEKWNVDSLAALLRECVDQPTKLEDLYPTCELPAGFTHADYVKRLLDSYQYVLKNCHV